MIIPLDDDLQVNLAKLPKRDWDRIKRDVSFLIKSKVTEEIGKAYIAAFFMYLEDLAILSTPYDPDIDKFN